MRTPAGRAFAYEAAVDEPDLAVRRISELLDSSSDRAQVLSRFIGGLPAREAKAIKAMLDVDRQGQALMVGSLAFPLLVTLAVAAIATSAHRRLPPRLATRFVTIALVLVVRRRAPDGVGRRGRVPRPRPGHRSRVPVVRRRRSGFTAPCRPGSVSRSLALIGVGAVRTVRLLRQHRALRLDESHPIHIAHSHKPYAVTLPGRAGQIVISTAMVDLLDDDEQRIVVAHERAHARYRHDRYLLTAELAAAALPPLRALARRVNYSIERWADEAAAAVCGDRELVAVTLGKVALQTHPPTVAGFSGLGVASRMGALLRTADPEPAPCPARRALVEPRGHRRVQRLPAPPPRTAADVRSARTDCGAVGAAGSSDEVAASPEAAESEAVGDHEDARQAH